MFMWVVNQGSVINLDLTWKQSFLIRLSLQQSCPPPIPECQEEPIEGFCCPRYECPIKSESMTVAEERLNFPNQVFSSPGSDGTAVRPASNEVKGCEVQGSFYEQGTIVDKVSTL